MEEKKTKKTKSKEKPNLEVVDKKGNPVVEPKRKLTKEEKEAIMERLKKAIALIFENKEDDTTD